MLRPRLIHFYSIATFLFSRSIISSGTLLCHQTPFPELCNTLVGRKFKAEPSTRQSRGPLGDSLTVVPTTFDAEANKAWTDCLELYEDVMHHLNHSMRPVNLANVQKWLREALVNHQACQNGFKDASLSPHLANLVFVSENFTKSLLDLLVENKLPSTSKLSLTNEHRFVQLGEEGAVAQPNIVVAQDGSSDYTTITEAIKALEERRAGSSDRFIIYVKSGVYKENIVIKPSMTNLTLIGDGIDATVITSDKSIGRGYTTYDTATFQVWGAGFVANGITFENTAGPGKRQAVALLSASDFSAFYKCSFKGYQDTLCLHQNRQVYRECDIYGTIDFIFGYATAILQNCNIYVRNPLPGQQNAITAQGRMDPRDPTGFIIHNSRVTAAPDLALALANGSVRTFLGRPWKKYSRVVYIKCYLDGLIDPEGWMPYHGNSSFNTVYYAEYMNNGTGADTDSRVSWPGYHVLRSVEEAEQFSVGMFLGGESWISLTGVPFDSTL